MQDAPKALQPLCLLNVVGLTQRLLRFAPRLAALGEAKPLQGVVPAVTMTAQATMLTGLSPSGHGIVGNGWFDRGFGEVRMWPQSHALVQGESLYAAARRLARAEGRAFVSTKLFWWFNQGAPVDIAVTPKPYYGSDGNKVFAVHGKPTPVVADLVRRLGAFPFPAFWGPMAGLASSTWIANAAAHILREHQPTLSMVYLPHLDYDLQRLGPDHPSAAERVKEVDIAAGKVIDAATETKTNVLVISEYGIVPVSRPIFPNRSLRAQGLLTVRDGPFGEGLETFQSRAFCVCDHQVAHVYVRDSADIRGVSEILSSLEGVAQVLDRRARVAMGLEHPRAGDLLLLAEPDAWFAYPYWLDDARAPDFARSVDIHRKPGYDPAELFFDPRLRAPKLRAARRLIQKKFGMRYRMDVVPLDPACVRGSHGLAASDPADGPLGITNLPHGLDRLESLSDVKDYALRAMGF